jgi:hypothetical protein
MTHAARFTSLFIATIALIGCTKSEDLTSVEPRHDGDEMTIEQIVGTYIPAGMLYSHGYLSGWGGLNTAGYPEDIQLTFNSDYTGEEFNPVTSEKIPFTWSYRDKIISFKHSLHGDIQGWFKNNLLKYKAKTNDPNYSGTYSYRKEIVE